MQAQNTPVLTIGDITSAASTISVPVSAVNFNKISGGNLKILYDPMIALPVAVSKGAGLSGKLDFNISDEGVIRIGWYTYPAVQLADGSDVFQIRFIRVGIGTANLMFDGTGSDMDCQFYDENHQVINDHPFDTFYKSGSLTFTHNCPVTAVPNLITAANEILSVPVTVTDFNNIGAISLTLQYDPAVLDYNFAETYESFPGLLIYNPVPGIITVSGTVNDADGYSLPDGTCLFTINCTYRGGSTDLTWIDDGTSCEYAGPQSAYVITDTPFGDFYENGRIGNCTGPENPVVLIVPPLCESVTGSIIVESPKDEEFRYSIDGLNYQRSDTFTNLIPGKYYVTVMDKEGCVSSAIEALVIDEINRPATPLVEVTEATCSYNGSARIYEYDEKCRYDFNPSGPSTDAAGNIIAYSPGQSYSLTAVDDNGCESLTSAPFIINDRLEAPVPFISVMYEWEMCEQECLSLTSSKGEHYLWSTGDTTQSIVVDQTGEYFVEVTYGNGCAATSNVLPVIVLPVDDVEAVNDQLVVNVYPNPFSTRLLFEFLPSVSGTASINIFDINGRVIKNVFNQAVDRGIIYQVEYLSETLSNKIYFYTVTVGNSVSRGKIIQSTR